MCFPNRYLVTWSFIVFKLRIIVYYFPYSTFKSIKKLVIRSFIQVIAQVLLTWQLSLTLKSNFLNILIWSVCIRIWIVVFLYFQGSLDLVKKIWFLLFVMVVFTLFLCFSRWENAGYSNIISLLRLQRLSGLYFILKVIRPVGLLFSEITTFSFLRQFSY